MPIVRIKRNHNYRRDTRLSWKARGILAYLLDHEDDWEVNVQDLITQSCEDGRIAVQKALQELIKSHYAKLETVRDEHGRVKGKRYVIYEAPYDLADEQVSRQSQNLPVGTDEQENRQSQNLPVGEEPYAVTRDDRRAGFPTVRKTDDRETCSIKDLKKEKIREESKGGMGEKSARSPARTKPSKFLPEDFMLTDTLRQWAQQEVPGVDITYQTKKMALWEFKQPHSDWDKAWKNWMLRAWEALPPASRTNRPHPRRVAL